MKPASAGPGAASLTLPAVQLQLLGTFGFNVHREVRTSLLTYDKPRLMLAMLALADGQAISRARLVELLWPDISEKQGKARMRHALHVLRQALTPRADVLIVHNDSLALRADELQVDVLAMLADDERAIDDEMCLALYKGNLLDDLQSRIDGPLHEWFEHWRQRLALRLEQCRARLMSGWLAKNQLNEALRYARHWVQTWPAEESCYRMLIEVLVRAGRYEEARRVYSQCKTALASLLGITPDSALELLIGNLPLSHAEHTVDGTDCAPPRYRPVAALAIVLNWRLDCVTELADSDALERLDQACASVRRCVQQYGGWLAPSGGNQIVAYLGFPGASTNPAARAADLAYALLQRPLPAVLSMSIGLHADLGLCGQNGKQPDSGYWLAQTALGLAGQAQPGETLVSDQAQSRIDAYEVQCTQRHGQTYRVLGERKTPAVSRMFGRSNEFTALVAAWRECLTLQRTVRLSLSGACGQGKSLLAASLVAQARQANASVVWLRCMQDLCEQSLHPFRLWLLERLPFDVAQAGDEDIAATLGLPVQRSRALMSLLKNGSDGIGLGATPEVLQIASRVVTGEIRDSRPLLIVLDDAHWADSVTREWMDMLAKSVGNHPAMVLTIRRSDTGVDAGHRHIELPPLDEQAVSNLLTHHARTLKLGKGMQDEIARQGGGNPRLISMMLMQVAAHGDIERPMGLRDLLCGQLLDLDGRTRQLAYLCALYGQPMSIRLAAFLLQQTTGEIIESAAQLRAVSILFAAPNEQLQCPAIVSYAITDLISPAQSSRLSEKIVQYLLEQQQPPALLAPFLERAGDTRAPIWWKAAAIEALHKGSFREAAHLVNHALRTKDAIADESAKEQFIFDCQMLRGSIAGALAGPTHPEVISSFSMASEMRRAGDIQTIVVALWAKWSTAQHSGEHVEALGMARQLMHIAQSLQDIGYQGWAAYAVAQHYLWRGLGSDAELLLCQAEALLGDAPPAAESPFGIQTSAFIPASLAMAYGLQGKYDHAFRAIERATHLALETNARVAVLICKIVQARLHYLQDDLDQAARIGAELMAQAGAANELTAWHAIATGYAMLPRVLRSQDATALLAMENALPVIRTGMPVSVDGHLCLLARARMAMGDLDGARAILNEAQALGAAHGSHSLMAEIQCLLGDSWAVLGDEHRAGEHWQDARRAAELIRSPPYLLWVDARLGTNPAATSEMPACVD